VNLLAAQALEKRTTELRAEVAQLREQNARLLDRLRELEAMVRSMVGAESN
jgi:chaperonin cofactor prefoldin